MVSVVLKGNHNLHTHVYVSSDTHTHTHREREVEVGFMCFPVPYQPLNLHADPLSPNHILVMWDAPQEADSIISYELYYNDSHSHQNVRVSIPSPVNSYKLDDLTPNTVYHIQVSAKSTRGEGPRTSTIQVKTHQFGKLSCFGGKLTPKISPVFTHVCLLLRL